MMKLSNNAQILSKLSTYVMTDAENQFPEIFFSFLRDNNALKIDIPISKPGNNISNTFLLQLLQAIGRKNLSGGRIFEGHLNAVQLIKSFANSYQLTKWSNDILEQKLFGVWNTQGKDGVQIIDQGDGTYKLKGSKIFCSGANYIQRPIITGEWTGSPKQGWQMILLSQEKKNLIKCDPEFWHPLGMKASVSYRMTFTDMVVYSEDLLGQPGDYYQQPLFSGGAIRFAAVQLGGAEAIFSEVHKILKSSERTNYPFQQSRVAEITYLVETGNLWISKAALLADELSNDDSDPGKLVAYANMTRSVIEDICLRVMQLGERSIGSQAFLQSSPLEQLHRDLTTYLRQPGPDAVLTDVGNYAFKQKEIINLWKLEDE
ncbi:acyl-CoA dehydrogenase family protein [Mucilaginibacter aquaedulcis]|uniref:acyl-CoA dehydrogenase family protein n=1 Tax=Mucilaginibacter aquaedulcis TaxID=1187081 RepID=UPI0025B2CA1B|nr:acyl-CoA dehydrogenase family protein [Mucilaginibacter aquaedulcis]MDN3550207.1 acyl-CoA dehydrogenase family protein [Mucilaginibacter aquaedulcis]